MRTCHHLHGGMGVDITYPMSRATRGSPTSPTRRRPRDDVTIEDPTTKNLELAESQRALGAELRTYFTGLADSNEHRDMALDRHGETYQRVVRQMGEDGWMVGWLREYGGHGLGEIEQTIFANEAQRADVHLPAVTLQTVGPTLIRYGTQKQKDTFLLSGSSPGTHFAIRLQRARRGNRPGVPCAMTARRDCNHHVVNGQKLWTTGGLGHQATCGSRPYPTRTPQAPQDLSILIVDTSDPGYPHRSSRPLDGFTSTATYFNDVRAAGRHAGRRGEPGLEADQHPAQPMSA